MINLFSVYQNATIEIPFGTVYHTMLNPLIYPLKQCIKRVYQIKLPVIERFIKPFIRLKNSKRVFLSLHFLKPFLRVFHIPKPFYFRTHIRLSRGIWKSNTVTLSSVKLIKKVHYLHQLQKGLITEYITWLITFIYCAKVGPRVYQMVDHFHLLRKGWSQGISDGWSLPSTAQR